MKKTGFGLLGEPDQSIMVALAFDNKLCKLLHFFLFYKLVEIFNSIVSDKCLNSFFHHS